MIYEHHLSHTALSVRVFSTSCVFHVHFLVVTFKNTSIWTRLKQISYHENEKDHSPSIASGYERNGLTAEAVTAETCDGLTSLNLGSSVNDL